MILRDGAVIGRCRDCDWKMPQMSRELQDAAKKHGRVLCGGCVRKAEATLEVGGVVVTPGRETL